MKTKMIQVGDNAPNCPKCGNSNAMLGGLGHVDDTSGRESLGSAFMDKTTFERVLTCRDCEHEVKESDAEILRFDFDHASRKYTIDGKPVDCGEIFDPDFSKFLEAATSGAHIPLRRIPGAPPEIKYRLSLIDKKNGQIITVDSATEKTIKYRITRTRKLFAPMFCGGSWMLRVECIETTAKLFYADGLEEKGATFFRPETVLPGGPWKVENGKMRRERHERNLP